MNREKRVKCPFNSNHIVWEDSLQKHIIHCMVKYPEFVTCPYNALHRFATKELLGEHMLVCNSRDKAYLFSEIKEPERYNEELVHNNDVRKFNLKYEDWDKEYP